MIVIWVIFVIGIDYVSVLLIGQLMKLVIMIVVIKMMFSIIGVVVVVWNWLIEFKMFDNSVVMEMNIMQGKQIWLYWIVIDKWLLLVNLDVIVKISYGIVIIVIIVKMIRMVVRVDIVFLVKVLVWVGLFSFLENMGIKVMLNVFLVKKWWNRLGRENVMIKVLVMGLVLRVVVIMILCMNFSICDVSV